MSEPKVQLLATVLHLPMPVRSCHLCEHFELVENGEDTLATWCGEWDDEIDNVDQARACTDFVRTDEQPTGLHPQTIQGAP